MARRKKGPARPRPKQLAELYRDDLREALGRGGKRLSSMRRALELHGAGTLDAPDAAVKAWSDLHLGHANIIGYQDRPFNGVGEMDSALWANWQVDVRPDEVMVCVGDFALGGAVSDETWASVRHAPGATKVLVAGNHDVDGLGRSRVGGFDRTVALLVSPGDPPLIWTHAPLPRVPAGHVNVHGHQHGFIKASDSPHVNVSVEQLDYRPVALSRIRRLARAILAGERPEGATTLARIEHVERGAAAAP